MITEETFDDTFLGLWGVAASQLISHLIKDEHVYAWDGIFPSSDEDAAKDRWANWRDWLSAREGHDVAIAFGVEGDHLVPVRRFNVSATHIEAAHISDWFGPVLSFAAGRRAVWTAIDMGGES